MESVNEGQGKIERVLSLYTSLMNGAIINKASAAVEFGVNERSIQRDIDDIRNFLADQGTDDSYSRPFPRMRGHPPPPWEMRPCLIPA